MYCLRCNRRPVCIRLCVSQVAVTFAVGSEVGLQSSSDFSQMGKPFLMGTVALGKLQLCAIKLTFFLFFLSSSFYHCVVVALFQSVVLQRMLKLMMV